MAERIAKSWTVVRHKAGGAGPGLNWFTDREKADIHAREMACRNPGKRFVILEVVGTVTLPLPDVAIEEV